MSAKVRRFLGGSGDAVQKEIGTTMELGAYTDNDKEGNWVRWKDLCGEAQQEEVFRDHKGVWVGPGGAEKKEEKKPQMVHNEPVR